MMLPLLQLVHARAKGGAADAAIRMALEALAARENDVQAFVGHAGVPAPGAATARQGPLAGMPVGIKDIVDVAGMATQMGSPIYAGWMPKADAAITMALRRAGAVIAGKTHTTPFAFLDPAPTRNPHNLHHSPGGSSAGSAAAVAAGMVALSVGTQTGGSMIRPASYCGVAAIKPSFRLLPTVGVKCYSWSLDTLGLFAASVADIAFGLAAISGRPELRVDETNPARFKFGVTRQAWAGEAEAASQQALETAVAALVRAGHAVVEIAIPQACHEGWQAHQLLSDYEALSALAWERDYHRAEMPPKLTAALDEAEQFSVADYDAARRTAKNARRAIFDVFDGCDALLTYSAPGEAPALAANSTGTSQFNRLWTLLGMPCVNVAGLRGPNNLPVGVQVITPFARDARALAAAFALESAITD